jgi:D-alanyl-D-alanine carboxypeptidase
MKGAVMERWFRASQVAIGGLLACLLASGGAFAKYASIVIDAKTGEVLHEAGADDRNHPASMAKMMTLRLVFKAIDDGRLSLQQPLSVSARAAAAEPTKLGVQPGDRVTVEECILGMVTRSANDCAVVFAETLAGSEKAFVRLMTEEAQRLGMTRTAFRNASGLPNAGQLTTARDMARLAQALIYDHAQYYEYFNTRSFVFRGQVITNHNRLMNRYEGMDGLKTGFINASGFNLAASAIRNDRRLIGVVFGGQTAAWRDNHMADLLDAAFSNEKRPTVMVAARSVPNAKPDAAKRQASAPERRAAQKRNQGTPPADGRWSIQIGAFNDRQSGQQALNKVSQSTAALTGGADRQIATITTAKGVLYRARLAGLDEKQARRACAQLVKAGQRCLVVPPV